MNAIKFLFVSIVLFFLPARECVSGILQPLPLTGKVVKIRDGDTIELLSNGKVQAVRLAHVDCPEKKQPFGNSAKQFTAALCFGKTVTVDQPQGYDRYGRLIGVLITGQQDTVNLELIRAGLAWHYTKYSTDTLYAQAEINARQAKVGLWVDQHPIAPWDWR